MTSFTFNNIKQNTSTFERLKQLKNSPTDLWIILILKFFESLAYFTTSFILVIQLSEEFDLDDEQAGLLQGFSGICICVQGLFMGFIIDHVGIKWSLQMGFAFLILQRMLFTISENQHIILFSMFVLRPLGSCLGIPVMQIAIKRYSDSNTRSAAQSLFQMAMNLAAIVAAPLSDQVRINFKEGFRFNWVGKELFLSSQRMTQLVSFLVTCLNFMVVNFIREVRFQDGMEHEQLGEPKDSKESRDPSLSQPHRPTHPTLNLIQDVLATKAFCKFMIFVLLLTGVRCVFRNLDTTFPKQMIREQGSEIKFGSILALNPLLVTFMVPSFMFLSQKMDAYTQICWGIMFTTLSPMFLAVETSIWMALVFVFTLSLGESIWSPRLYEQSMEVAKEGREGTYIALSSAPLFLSSFISGAGSGQLLETQCPKEGQRESWKMWLIVSCCSSLCSLCVIVFEKQLRINKGDEFEHVECMKSYFNLMSPHDLKRLATKELDQSANIEFKQSFLKNEKEIFVEDHIRKITPELELNYSFNEEFAIINNMSMQQHEKVL